MVAQPERALPPLAGTEDSPAQNNAAPAPGSAAMIAGGASASGLIPPSSIESRDPKLAAYIAQMSIELSSMARAAGFDLLAYFLDMARIEANIQSGKDS